MLKQINGILGGAVGLCEGIVLCTLFILLCAIYVPLNSNFFINQTLINQSYFFSQIYYSDVVVMISSFVSEGKEAFGLFKNIGCFQFCGYEVNLWIRKYQNILKLIYY